MVNDENYKEVNYSKYCGKCENKDLDETLEPCDSCMSEPARLYSEKPVKFKQKGQ